jgi:hypothetical protein
MHYLIIAACAAITCCTAFSMEIKPQETFNIKHPDGDITVPTDIVQKYSALRAATAATKTMNGTFKLEEYDHKHVCTFFDIIQNKLTTPLGHNNLESLLALNDYLSAGDAKEQLLFQKQITSPLNTFLKTNPKKLYQHTDKLCLYENIFDAVDNATKKYLATLADNPEEETSFCCALYMAMYNSRLSKLWYAVTQATPIDIRTRPGLTPLVQDDAKDPFLLALGQWKEQDPARRLFGKLMDALGHDSRTPGITWLGHPTTNESVTSLHNFDECFYDIDPRYGRLSRCIKGGNIGLGNAFDRCHLPLVAEWCKYIRERANNKKCSAWSDNTIYQIDIGHNQSIRRFYDVDSMALRNPVFQPRSYEPPYPFYTGSKHKLPNNKILVTCETKKNASLDGLNTIPPTKSTCFKIPSLPSSTHYADRDEQQKRTLYFVTPPWWKLKTIATWIAGAGILYAISKSVARAHLDNKVFYTSRIDNEFFNVITYEDIQAFRAIKSVNGESYVQIMNGDLVKVRLNAIVNTWQNTTKSPLTLDSLFKANSLLKTAKTIDTLSNDTWWGTTYLGGIATLIKGCEFLYLQGMGFLWNTIGLVFPHFAERTCTICVDKPKDAPIQQNIAVLN